MSKNQRKDQIVRPASRPDLVELVTVPVLRRANQTTAKILEKINDVEESIAMIARQIQRGNCQ